MHLTTLYVLHKSDNKKGEKRAGNRVGPRFFDQVGHETMYASRRNKHFFIKSCHRQTYQNYEQSQQNWAQF